MTLTEILVAASLQVISASASLQVWASGSRWSLRSEQRLEQQQALEAELLAVQARLRAAGRHPRCGRLRARRRLAGEPAAGAAASGGRGAAAAPGRRFYGGERQRWYDPAAYGLCNPSAAPLQAPSP
jgi:Type II secretory pathway, component PulJ